jgi:hypothetical protein
VDAKLLNGPPQRCNDPHRLTSIRSVSGERHRPPDWASNYNTQARHLVQAVFLTHAAACLWSHTCRAMTAPEPRTRAFAPIISASRRHFAAWARLLMALRFDESSNDRTAKYPASWGTPVTWKVTF